MRNKRKNGSLYRCLNFAGMHWRVRRTAILYRWLTCHNGESCCEQPTVLLFKPKMALVIGTESTGASDVMLKAADRRVYMPMNGFADSLNLSVAAALSIYHIFFIYPEIIGDFNAKNLQALRVAWYDTLARNDKRRLNTVEWHKNLLWGRSMTWGCDQHRTGWTSRKDKRNNLKAGFNVGIGHWCVL